jgi:spore maturation protein CgeB
MLHERTQELAAFFVEGGEVACVADGDEMADKVAYYLAHDDERERNWLAGYRRCVAEDGSEQRARKVIERYRSRAASVGEGGIS